MGLEAGANIRLMCAGHGKPLDLAEQTEVGKLLEVSRGWGALTGSRRGM